MPRDNTPAFLTWVGKKNHLLETLNTIYQTSFSDRRLVEPFAGSISVALKLKPKEALLNDINPHIINLYKHVKRGFRMNKYKTLFDNTSDTYYQNRELFNELLESDGDEELKACLTYYLNKTCYRGLWRENSRGEFNVPYGNRKQIRYLQGFSEYYTLMLDWEFSSKDFSELEIKPSDFIYCDPPYYQTFSDYSKYGFEWRDQVRLVEWLSQFNNPIIVSNSGDTKVVELYAKYGFDCEFIPECSKLENNRSDNKRFCLFATKGF